RCNGSQSRLSIKGIAIVEPSLDLWGQLAGGITVSGNMKVGAKYTMDAIEMYMPNYDNTRQKASSKMEKVDKDDKGLSPVFQAGIKATVGVELRTTPEINCGIKVGGDIGPLKEPLLQGQVAVYTNTTLYFESLRIQTQPFTSKPKPLLKRMAKPAIGRPVRGISTQRCVRSQRSDPLYELPSPEDSIMVAANLYNHTDLDLPPFSILSVRTLEGSGHAVRMLHLRGGGKEHEFMLGDFKCTTGSSPCSTNIPNTPRIRPRGHGNLFSHSHDHSVAVRAIPKLQKCAATDCPNQVPRSYYNYAPKSFSNVNLQAPSGNAVLPDICTSVRRYLTAHGIDTDQFPLHWNPSYNNERRGETCSGTRSPCSGVSGEDARFKAATGVNTALVMCDKFPIASSEEGSELLSSVATNVEYFKKHGSPTEDKPSWIPLDANEWSRDKEFREHGGPGCQRLTRHANTRPYLRHGENGADDHKDWYRKRNFTLIFVNANANKVNFPGSNFASDSVDKSSEPATTTVSGSAWMMCAVSLRGQQCFQFKKGANVDRYCWDGQTTSAAAGGQFQRQEYSGCKIDFVDAAFANVQRRAEPIGYSHDEAVYGIERVDDAEPIVVDVPVADAMLPGSRVCFPLS
ncbi:hypothetical protein EKO04_005158, partial [Ascochyta lentis]